jgi:energy-coupling factor transporter ATP-binding protein EcfA2
MAVGGFRDEKAFGEHLQTVLSPAKPVDDPTLLHGRDEALKKVSRALYADGRHVFIYGDRGVGKSSVAKTAASLYRDGRKDYLWVSCERNSTLFSVMHSLARSVIELHLGEERVRKHEFSIAFGPLRYQIESTTSTPAEPLREPTNLDECMQLAADIANICSPKAIVVVDEFDAIEHVEDRQRFADLLKRMGDRGVPLKFIISGIATSMHDLLEGHLSSIRQLETVDLNPLDWSARFEIIQAAGLEFDLQVAEAVSIRIAAISNGFPHYVHLLTEQLLWQAFDDPADCQVAEWGHFRNSLDAAVGAIAPHLRRPYDMATQRVSDDYRDIVWAAADAFDLQRHSSKIFDSYVWICQQSGKLPLERSKFSQRLNDLKKPHFGKLLKNLQGKSGWYEFSENMLRGFVRLVSEHAGIQLRDRDYDKEPKRLTARAPVVRSLQAYRRDYTPPVRFRGEIEGDDQS